MPQQVILSMKYTFGSATQWQKKQAGRKMGRGLLPGSNIQAPCSAQHGIMIKF